MSNQYASTGLLVSRAPSLTTASYTTMFWFLDREITNRMLSFSSFDK